MTHQLPQLLPHCKHKHFCAVCRDIDAGRDFRQGAIDRQGINCHVDFECPKGKPWKSRGLGDNIAKATKADIAARLAVCESCPSLKKAKPELNAVKCKDCGCGNLSLINGSCPRSLWPTGDTPCPRTTSTESVQASPARR